MNVCSSPRRERQDGERRTKNGEHLLKDVILLVVRDRRALLVRRHARAIVEPRRRDRHVHLDALHVHDHLGDAEGDGGTPLTLCGMSGLATASMTMATRTMTGRAAGDAIE